MMAVFTDICYAAFALVALSIAACVALALLAWRADRDDPLALVAPPSPPVPPVDDSVRMLARWLDDDVIAELEQAEREWNRKRGDRG